MDPKINIGDLMISTAAVKNEGTSKFYVPENFPAVPDFEFTQHLLTVARDMAKDSEMVVYSGISSTDDAFYGETPEFVENLRRLKIMNIEMEASSIYTVGHLRGVRTACICGCSGNLTNEEVIYTRKNEKLAEAWEKEIRIVLETIYRFEQAKA